MLLLLLVVAALIISRPAGLLGGLHVLFLLLLFALLFLAHGDLLLALLPRFLLGLFLLLLGLLELFPHIVRVLAVRIVFILGAINDVAKFIVVQSHGSPVGYSHVQ